MSPETFVPHVQREIALPPDLPDHITAARVHRYLTLEVRYPLSVVFEDGRCTVGGQLPPHALKKLEDVLPNIPHIQMKEMQGDLEPFVPELPAPDLRLAEYSDDSTLAA